MTAPKTKIAVCTLYTPEYENFAKYTTLNIRHYCNIHGYDYIEQTDNFINITPLHPYPHWNKQLLMKKVLSTNKYDWIFMIDCDAVITNKNVKLENIINNNIGNDDKINIIVSQEECGCCVLNSGMMLIKNTEWSRKFIDDWFNKGELPNAQWRDQDTFHYFYNNEEVRAKVKVVKQKVINSFPQIFTNGDFVLHYAGRDRAPLKQLAYYNEQNYVSKRDEIPSLLKKLKLIGEGIEIGVHRGIYSETILNNSNLNKLYLCDLWKHQDTKTYSDIANVCNEDQDKIFAEVEDKIKNNTLNRDRTHILKMSSSEAVKTFEDNSLDFVYIDANHKYEYVIEDIKNWYPKVKNGAIIAGHDYLDGELPIEGSFGVKRAVIEFFGDTQHVYLTDENWPSWYVIKNEKEPEISSTSIELNKDIFDLIFKDVKPNQVFVDVGAFNGDTIERIYNYNLRIISIEPIKSLVDIITQKYQLNKNITIINKACWSNKQTLQFHEYQGWGQGLSTVQQEMIQLRSPESLTGKPSIDYNVEADTLDNILTGLNIDTIDYLKINTEGSEGQVLSGFTKYHKGTRFHIESHVTNLNSILCILLEMGCNIEKISLKRDDNIKEHVIGTVIGVFQGPEKEKEKIKTIIGDEHGSMYIIDRQKWIHQQIKPGDKILDIGSADGWIFKGTAFAPYVTSIDLDLYDIPNFIRMDAQDLKFLDNSFDVAVLGEILEHVDDPVKVLKEAKRVSRKIIITVPDEVNWDKQLFPYETPEQTAKRRGMTVEQVVKVSNPNAKEFINDGYKHLFHGRHYDEESLRADLQDAGITNYEMNRLQYQGWSFFVVVGEDVSEIGQSGQSPPTNSTDSPIGSCTEVLSPKTGPTITYPAEEKKKLRIALISTPFFTVPPSGYSGLEQIVWDLAEGLDELGHKVTIFAPDGSKATKHGHVITTGPSVNTVNVNWFEEEKRMYEKYKSIITPEKYDIVHGSTWFGFEFLLKVINPKLNVVHTHHGGYNWDSPPPVDKPNLVAISKFMKNYTEQYFKQKGFDVPCSYVYNGIDLNKYAFQKNKTDRLLFVGRLSTFKCPHIAVELARRTGHGLDIVGGTFVDSIEYVRQLDKMVENDPNIKIYKDVTHEFKIKKMQEAKALIFPSNMGEPYGLVASEAMSCGTPVIASNDGAISEVVIHGKTGFICETIEQMVEAVKNIHTIKPENCRKRAEELSREVMAKNYEKLYYLLR